MPRLTEQELPVRDGNLPLVWQYCSLWLVHCLHLPHDCTWAPTPTLSPFLNSVTLAPTADTRPTISWPVTQGRMGLNKEAKAARRAKRGTRSASDVVLALELLLETGLTLPSQR